MVRILGVEPSAQPWEGYILAAIRYPHGMWSHLPGSNRRPARYECAALPTELRWHTYISTWNYSRLRTPYTSIKANQLANTIFIHMKTSLPICYGRFSMHKLVLALIFTHR